MRAHAGAGFAHAGARAARCHRPAQAGHSQHAGIKSCYYVTGDVDFVLIISARDMEDYDTTARQFFYNKPDVKGFKTMVVIDRVKASIMLSLADD